MKKNDWIFGIIIAAMFLVGSNLVYKTFQLRNSMLNLSHSVAELDLSSKEFSCDIAKFEAYEQGQHANNE